MCHGCGIEGSSGPRQKVIGWPPGCHKSAGPREAAPQAVNPILGFAPVPRSMGLVGSGHEAVVVWANRWWASLSKGSWIKAYVEAVLRLSGTIRRGTPPQLAKARQYHAVELKTFSSNTSSAYRRWL